MRRFATAGAPHIAPTRRVRGLMLELLAALLPAVLAHWWFFGPGILVQIALAVAFALTFEATMLKLRARPIQPFLGDGSAAVAAVLFALCVPPWSPWWISALGMLAAIVLAKQLYGGLGHNPFNPAMVGYAVVLLSFPLELSSWLPPAGAERPAPGWSATLAAIFLGERPGGWDAITAATPLERIRHGRAEAMTLSEIRTDPAFGVLAGRGWEWIALLYLAGGLWLCWRRVAAWQVPAGMLGAAFALSLVLHLWDPSRHPGPFEALLLGGLLLGAFFIATDPVSGSTTPRGRWIFGIGCGLLVIAIRTWGGYPDGVAFAVLLMNCTVPWLDLNTRPRVFGESGR